MRFSLSSNRMRTCLSGTALVVFTVAATTLGGCEDMIDTTGSIAAPAKFKSTDNNNLRADADNLGKQYEKDPGEKSSSINYARALRAETRYAEAAAVMQTAAIRAPFDFEVLGEYGKALADSGDLAHAKEVLSRAYTPDRPSPTIMSVQGVVDDELGDHEGARTFYRGALKISPGDPAILNNLGLSYLLTRQLPESEAALRQANASPEAGARERDNLAMVLAVESKLAKSRRLSGAGAPAKGADVDERATGALGRSKEAPPAGAAKRLAYARE
jgi:Flp pilus assembly protein TadD